MASMFGSAVRVKVKKCEGNQPAEWRKFSIDPQITSLEVLYSILAKAFDLKSDFSISYRTVDPTNGQESFLVVVSDWDLEAAILRSHNYAIATHTEPALNLRMDIKAFSEAPAWETDHQMSTSMTSSSSSSSTTNPAMLFQQSQKFVQNKFSGLLMNQMEKTLSSIMQRAMNFVEDPAPRPPLSDGEFRQYCDSVGQIVHAKELKRVIYAGGIDPSLRRVVWKHLLNLYPAGMTGKARMDYIKKKSAEYYKLRETWRQAVQSGNIVGDLAYVTSMVRKDVLRTDRLHPFYAGSDENQNIAALFNILTTYALNHPEVSYCQGMSDIASPLLVIMTDEPQAYICFCAIMLRLRSNFMVDGIAMTQKFAHLAEALEHYDPEFYAYLKMHQADDLLFCYRWLLLEMKREFAFDDSLRMLEVLWSSLPANQPETELPLYDKMFEMPPAVEVTAAPPIATEAPVKPTVGVVLRPRESNYTKVCELRRQSSALSLYSNMSLASSTNPIGIHQSAKLDTTKRLNQSMDENLSRERLKNFRKTHLSLDEREMMLLQKQRTVPDEVVEPTTKDTNPFLSPACNSSAESISPVSPVRNPLLRHSSSGSPLRAKKLGGGGHFRELKEKIAAGKKAAAESEVSPVGGEGEPKVKLVKNFNEFLNFAAMNKSRIGDKTNTKVPNLAEADKSVALTNKRPVKLTSSDENIQDLSSPDDQCINEEDKSSSPDNSEYFPMTTSKTRELRLQLESLDRQVFGSDFRRQQRFGGTGSTTTTTTTTDTPPESADSLSAQSEDSLFFLTDINYTKLQQNPNEIQEVTAVPKMRRQPRQELGDNGSMDSLKRLSANNDVFVWENPLHSLGSCDELEKSALTTVTIETTTERLVKTPDEQVDIEYDGEIMEETQGKKSVTPIRLVRINEDKATGSNGSNRNSTLIYPNDSSSDDSEANAIFPAISMMATNDQPTSPLLSNPFNPNNPFYDQINLLTIEPRDDDSTNLMSTSCEEASEVVAPTSDTTSHRVAGATSGCLPPPHEFGGGNPFLMFLCLTILLQHRDYVMKSNMDYNEMAMHFDKMVRKHNVTRVLNQARRMYADYLKVYREAATARPGAKVMVNISGSNFSHSINSGAADGGGCVSKRGSNGEVFNV